MATSAAAAAVIAQATKASGVIVRMEAEDFQQLLHRIREPLVVIAPATRFRKKVQYLTSHKGIAFFTTTVDQLHIPGGAEVVAAKQIWIP
jgi:hypothetical protein